MKSILLLTVLSIISAPVLAGSNDPETSKSPWSGNAKLGFIFSKTNETSMSVNSGASAIYDKDRWQQKGEFSTYYTKGNESSDGTNKYNLNYGVKHFINDDWFVYTNSKYEHDQYSTYREQVTAATGFGANLINEEDTKLSIGAGPGYRFSKRQDFDPDHPGNKEDEVIANGFIEGSSKLNDRFELGGELRVDYGEENTTTNVKGYIKNQLMAQVSLQLDTEYINNSTVAADSSNSEVYSTISLSYDY